MDQIYEAKVRLQSDISGPLRSGENHQVGFYDAGIMRQVLESVGSGSYKIWTVPVPENDFEYEQVLEMLDDPNIQYALVDKSQNGHKIVFCIVDDSPGWMSAFDRLGYKVHSGPKTNKRLKSAHRPTLLNADFDDLNIVIVDPTDYTRLDFSDTEMETDLGVAPWLATPEAQARLLDGGFVISRRMIHAAVSNIPFYEPNDPILDRDYYYDPRVYQQMLEDLRNVPVVNARIVFKDGFLKGNAFVSDNLPEGIDVITSQDNIKKEFTYDNGYRFLAEPQGPKERVVTDPQTVINLPKLFTKSNLDFWLREEYKKTYNKAINGDLLSNWKFIYQRAFRDDRNFDDDEARIGMIYVGYRWTAAGFKVTQSPWLFETSSISHAKPLKKAIPVPCAVSEQIIPESLARMAGYDYEIDEGDIVRCNELGVHVISDIDWLEMYESHGGMDEDDFFKLFYRTMVGGQYDGEKVVIVARSPNGYGEYSIFRYVEGQFAPTWHTADGEAIMFPEVDGNAWPTRLSSAILYNQVTFTGLPSQNEKPEKRSGPYTKDDVIRDIKIAMSGGNVGGFVNACMAHSMVIGTHRPVQLCTLETAIDKCINPDHVADVIAIDTETKAIMREVLSSGNPIDEAFFHTRGLKRYLKRGQTVSFHDGIITYISELCTDYFDRYCNSIRQWSQENARPPEIVHQLGQRLKFHAYPALRGFRMKVFNTNATEVTKSTGAIERNAWENMYDVIVDKITSYERLLDSYDFVIALYSQSIQNPTSYGKVTDQIVMNRFVFPYLEEALYYYGVSKAVRREISGNKIRIVNDQVTSWIWTDANNNQTIFTDPLEFQAAHALESPIVYVSPPPPERRLTQSLY